MERRFEIGQKVVPIHKTAGFREHNNCATYYQRLEMNQDFLYVVGYDEEESQRLHTPCYWCNVVPVMGGDSFAGKDLIPYE
jgi:hypothetical protein